MDVKTIVRFAVFTRGLSLVLQAVLNTLIPDHVAEAFSPPRAEEPLFLDHNVEVLFSGLGRWDAEHFLFIAERGYVYEHNHAFFPLFPLVLRTVAAILLWPLGFCLTQRGCLLLAVAITNSALFVLSAVALYKLSRVVFQDRKLALIASLMFCITPANVFMLAGYSESLFAMLTFGGLLMLERGFTLRSGFLLSLACATRSNGLLNIGFPLYIHLHRVLNQTQDKVNHVLATLKFLLTSLFYIGIIALPFGLFQYYGYFTFCLPSVTPEHVSPALLKLATEKGYTVPDALAPTPSWCASTIPLLYSYIQDFYWNVGFLRYFQLRQIPNFLLALPVTVLGSMAVSMYIMRNPYFCLRLGLYDTETKKLKKGKPEQGFYSKKVFVYVIHCSILLIFGVFCMHVQVLTRFLASSSPLIYWISAHILLSYEPLLQKDECFTQRPTKQHKTGHLFLTNINNPVFQLLLKWKSCCFYTHCVLGYFLLYWLLGLALHCNFLPWT